MRTRKDRPTPDSLTTGRERWKRGKEADLAVLSRDIFSAKPEEIAKARVVITMVGGRVVFTEGN
jgi:predicted amidohydrolase YtcJ